MRAGGETGCFTKNFQWSGFLGSVSTVRQLRPIVRILGSGPSGNRPGPSSLVYPDAPLPPLNYRYHPGIPDYFGAATLGARRSHIVGRYHGNLAGWRGHLSGSLLRWAVGEGVVSLEVVDVPGG